MINIIALNKKSYKNYKDIISRLIKSHKDGHITTNGYKHFTQITADSIAKKEDVIILAIHNNNVVGMLACGNKGRKFAITVVNKGYRRHGLGKSMLTKAIQECGGFYCEVASDNYPSLKTCFACNMVATDAFIRKGKVIMKMNTK